MFIGNQKIKTFFDQAHEYQSLAHTYCLTGPDGIGKRTLARTIAAELMGIAAERLDLHPDFYYVERSVDPKTEKRRADITIGQVRDLVTRAGRKSWSPAYSVVIIDEVERLTEEAGNALLKVLEEPPEKSVLFLLTNDEMRLLPTIRSRSQVFRLLPVPDPEICSALINEGAPETVTAEAVKMAHGLPGKAFRFIRDEAWREEYQQEKKRWHDLFNKPFYTKIQLLASWWDAAEETSDARGQIDKYIGWWIAWWRQELIQKVQSLSATVGATALTVSVIYQIMEELRSAQRRLRENIHPRLLIENILLLF